MTEKEAIKMAERLMKTKVEIKDLKNEESEMTEKLREYVKETSNTDLGSVMAYSKSTAPKIVGLEGKKLKQAIENLLESVDPVYIKETSKSLDLKEIASSIDTDKTLKSLLKKAGLKIHTEEVTHFKHVA